MEYHKKLLLLKRLAYPVVVALEKAHLFWLAAPAMNALCRVFGLKRRFNDDVEHRIFAKTFQGSFQPGDGEPVAAFLSLTGANDLHLLRNLMIGAYLQQRGHHPLLLVCDGVLEICSRDRVSRERDRIPFFCHECCGGYREVAKRTGADIRYLSAFANSATDAAVGEGEQRIQALRTIAECDAFVFRDVPLGRLTRLSTLYYLTIGAFENTPDELVAYKKYLASAVRLHQLLTRAFEEIPRLECLITNNGLHFHDAIARFLVVQRGITEVTQETYEGRDSWVYRRGGVAITMDFDEEWERFRGGAPLGTAEVQAIHDFMRRRRHGGALVYQYNAPDTPVVSAPHRRTVALFTNFAWDTTVLDRNTIFDSMAEWIVETIDYWYKRQPDAQLVIRAHPAEAQLLTMPSARYVRDIVRDRIDGEQVVFVDSCDAVSSYSMIDAMDYGIVYSSTIGLEVAYAGKACVVAGACHYRGKGFAVSPGSRQEYFDALDSLNAEASRLTVGQREELERYLVFVYQRQVKQLKGFYIGGDTGRAIVDVRDGSALLRLNGNVLDEFHANVFAPRVGRETTGCAS